MREIREVFYYARCEHCLKNCGYLLWGKNVNSSITTEDLYQMSYAQLGRVKKEECVHCGLLTLQTTVAIREIYSDG